MLVGRLSKSETETLFPVVKFVDGEDEDGDDGGTKELKLGVFLTFRGALGLYRSLGCVSKAALTIVELADRIAIFFFFSPCVLTTVINKDEAVTFTNPRGVFLFVCLKKINTELRSFSNTSFVSLVSCLLSSSSQFVKP